MTASLENLVQTLGATFLKKNLRLATAESCTGGGLSYWVTSVSGSSNWFERGFVTYSNEAKIELLNVKPATIQSFGAVSEETAREMAEGALARSAANLSIAITGIAGPEGGTTDKPVGTVWIAYASAQFPTQAQMDIYTGSRNEIREKVIEKALRTLLDLVNASPSPSSSI